jgi:predicted ATPase
MAAYGQALTAYAKRLELWKEETERLTREAAAAEAARRRQPLVLTGELARRVGRWFGPRSAAVSAGPRASGELLSDAERSHPFWRTGLGREALAHHSPPSDDGSASPDGSSKPSTSDDTLPPLPPPPAPPAPPRGIFLHGEVGVGKTMLMDLFFETVAHAHPVPCLRRVHYNAFMLEVNARLHQHSAVVAASIRAGAGVEADAAGATSAAKPEQQQQQQQQQQHRSAPARSWHVLGELVEQLLREPPRPTVDPTSQLIAEIAHDITSGEITANTPGPASGPGQPQRQLQQPPVPQAREVFGSSMGAGLLCFDELQMMDIADATIVTGVLRRLTDAGWVIVATCNRSLPELAESTQHERHPQAAFASVLQDCCLPVLVRGANGDYREKLASGLPAADCARAYLHPLSPAVERELDATFEKLAGGRGEPLALPVVFGRRLHVPHQRSGVARFSFDELCCRPLGASDYVALADAFHTVVLCGVPVLSANSRDHARRFITLVDCVYNSNGRLICSAAVPLRELFDDAVGNASVDLEGLEFEAEGGKSDELGTLIGNTNAPIDAQPAPARVSADSRKALQRDERYTGADERFAFRRALSRLLEMQSEQYARAARARAQSGPVAGGGALV